MNLNIFKILSTRKKIEENSLKKKIPLFKNYYENYIKLTGKAERELIAGGRKGRQGP